MLSDETWVQRERFARQTVPTQRQSHWRWIATPELDPYALRAIWRIGRQRWGVENHAFNELTKYCHREHCPHHHPVAIVAWLLILVLVFNLFEVFVRLHGKLWQQGKVTLQELALGPDRGLEHPEERSPLWSGWNMHRPPSRSAGVPLVEYPRNVNAFPAGEVSSGIERRGLPCSYGRTRAAQRMRPPGLAVLLPTFRNS